MLLQPKAAQRFIAGYSAVLLEVLRRSRKARSGHIIRDLAAARALEQKYPVKLKQALQSLAATGTPIAADVVAAIESRRVGQWVFLRNTTRHAVFLDRTIEHGFAVLGLTNPIDQIVGGQAATFETAVFEFEGHYVCDGIVEGVVFLGPSLRKEVNALLSSIKKAGRFRAKPAP